MVVVLALGEGLKNEKLAKLGDRLREGRNLLAQLPSQSNKSHDRM